MPRTCSFFIRLKGEGIIISVSTRNLLFTWWGMTVLYEFQLPRAGHRSCQRLVELSYLRIKAGRGHANEIAPERLALVQCDVGVFFLIHPYFPVHWHCTKLYLGGVTELIRRQCIWWCCWKLVGWGRFGGFGELKVSLSSVPGSGEAHENPSISWYRLEWAAASCYRVDALLRNFQKCWEVLTHSLRPVWAEGRFFKSLAEASKKCCCNVLFYF